MKILLSSLLLVLSFAASTPSNQPLLIKESLQANLFSQNTLPTLLQQEGKYPCAQSLTKMISELPNGNMDLLFLAYLSGKNINELGKYRLCTDDPSKRYLVLFVDAMFATFYMGICVPNQCRADDMNVLKSNVTDIINAQIDGLQAGDTLSHITTDSVQFIDSKEVNERARSPSAGTYVTLTFFIFFFSMAIVATIYELLEFRAQKKREALSLLQSSASRDSNAAENEPRRKRPCYRRFIGAFGVLKNYQVLMSPTTKSPEDMTDVLNGVRVLSMCWIIWGHTFYYYREGPILNPEWIVQLVKSWEFTFMESTPYAVDVFFMMTGFLGTYIMLSMMQNRKGRTEGIVKTYLHRYLRLLPLYVFIMLMFIFIVPLLASGPVFFRFNDLLIADCKKAWWAHLLYINNFYYPRPRGGDYCMGWTWYLPNDFQFFLFLPILVPIYYRNPKLSMLLFSGLLGICMIVEFAIVFHYKVSASLMKVVDEYWDVYYHKPWNRISPFIMGVFLGFMYVTYRNYKPSRQRGVNESDRRPPCFWRFTMLIKNNCKVRWAFYALGVFLLLSITLLNHSLNNYPEDWNLFEDAMYVIFARPLFVLGMLCFVYPAMIGEAPWVNKILAWYGWTPFAKVTYAAYLVHPVFMNLESYNQDNGQYASWAVICLLAVSYIVLVFALAIILSLIIEFPFINLEKEFLFPQKPRNTKKPNAEPSRRVYGAGGLGAGSIDAASSERSLSSRMSVESSGDIPNGKGSMMMQDLSREETEET